MRTEKDCEWEGWLQAVTLSLLLGALGTWHLLAQFRHFCDIPLHAHTGYWWLCLPLSSTPNHWGAHIWRHISCSFSRASGQGSLISTLSDAEVPIPRWGDDMVISSKFFDLPVVGDEEVRQGFRKWFLLGRGVGESRRAASPESQKDWENRLCFLGTGIPIL